MIIQPNKPQAQQLIHEGLLALSEATRQGMLIDVVYCTKINKILNVKISKLEKKFFKSKMGRLWKHIYKTPNINSDDQLRNILYDKLKAKVKKKTESKKPSCDNEALEAAAIDIPELKIFAEYKKLSKVQGTYIQGILKETVNGILHPSFNLHIPVTFRSSSQNINFQNIPNRDAKLKKLVRKAFIPSKGNQLMAADFSGIEVNVGACAHKDPKMLDYCRHPEKNNMHTDMAKQIYMLDQFQKEGAEKTLRKGAKNGYVFPQFYGDYYGNNALSLAHWGDLPQEGRFTKKQGVKLMTGITLGQHFINKGISNYDSFVNHIKAVEEDFWENRFKVYNKWKENNIKDYYKKGHLNMLTGFTCSGLLGPNDINNYPIQGPAFHCLLKTFIKTNKEIKKRGLKSRLIGQIHDELIIDADPSEVETLKTLLRWIACEWLREEWSWIIVPMEIEATVYGIDATWATEPEVTVLRAS